MAREVMLAGGMAGCVFNAAKEVALDFFIAGRIGFLGMSALVETTLARLAADSGFGKTATSLDDVLAMDQLARVVARGCASACAKQ
jgi:1-deoxy-D-xylulose-5-phosphate reductoisomerase